MSKTILNDMDDLDFITSPKLELLRRVKEQLADYHYTRTENCPTNHRSLATCDCDTAREYRAVKSWINKQKNNR